MTVQKIKKNIAILYIDDSNTELESFSLLHLNEEESVNILKAAKINPGIVDLGSTKIEFDYTAGDDFDKLFKAIALKHEKENYYFYRDTNKKFTPNIDGTSMLVRDVKNKIIYIGFRDNYNSCNINKIYIPNSIREKFFSDTKKCSYLQKFNKYAISHDDMDYYTKWCGFMNEAFLLGVKAKI